jgi:hypothetical protein
MLLDRQTGDYKLVNGDQVLASGIDAVRQNIDAELDVWRGECFLDEDEGLPGFEQVLVMGGNEPTTLAAVRETLRQAVLKASGVKSVAKITVTYNSATRRTTTSFTAIADDGTQVLYDGFQLGGA